MTIKEQVCTVGQAKRLKENKIMQDSLFYYVLNWKTSNGIAIKDGEEIISQEQRHIYNVEAKERSIDIEFVSAFTTDELGKLINSFASLFGGIHLPVYYNNFWLYNFADITGNYNTESVARGCLLLEVINACNIIKQEQEKIKRLTK